MLNLARSFRWILPLDDMRVGAPLVLPVGPARPAAAAAPATALAAPAPAVAPQATIEEARLATRVSLDVARGAGLPAEVTKAIEGVEGAIRELEAAMTPAALVAPGGKEACDKKAAALKQQVIELGGIVSRACDPSSGQTVAQRMAGPVTAESARAFAERALLQPFELKAALVDPATNRIGPQQLASFQAQLQAMNPADRARAQQALQQAGLGIEMADALAGSRLPPGTQARASLDVTMNRDNAVNMANGQQASRMDATVSGSLTVSPATIGAKIQEGLGERFRPALSYDKGPPVKFELDLAVKLTGSGVGDTVSRAGMEILNFFYGAATGKSMGETDHLDVGKLKMVPNANGQLELQVDGKLGKLLAATELSADLLSLKSDLEQAIRDAGFEVPTFMARNGPEGVGLYAVLQPRLTTADGSLFQVPPVPLGGDAQLQLQDAQVSRGSFSFDSNGALTYAFEAQANAKIFSGAGPNASHLPAPQSLSAHLEARVPFGNAPTEVELRDGHLRLQVDDKEIAAAQRFLGLQGQDVSASGTVDATLAGHTSVPPAGQPFRAQFAADVVADNVTVDIRAKVRERGAALAAGLPVAQRAALTEALASDDPAQWVKALRDVKTNHPGLAPIVDNILHAKSTHVQAGQAHVTARGDLAAGGGKPIEVNGSVEAHARDVNFSTEDIAGDYTRFHLDEGDAFASGRLQATPTALGELQGKRDHWVAERERMQQEVTDIGDAIAKEAKAWTKPDLAKIEQLLLDQEAAQHRFAATADVIARLDTAIGQCKQELEQQRLTQASTAVDAQGAAAVHAGGGSIDQQSITENPDGTTTTTTRHAEADEADAAAAGRVQHGTQGQRASGTAALDAQHVAGVDESVTRDKDGVEIASKRREFTADRVTAAATGTVVNGPDGVTASGSGQVTASGVAVQQDKVETRTVVERPDPLTQKRVKALEDDFRGEWGSLREELTPYVEGLYNRISPAERRSLEDALGSNRKNAGDLIAALQQIHAQHPGDNGLARNIDVILDRKIDMGLLSSDRSLRELQVLTNPKKPDQEWGAERFQRQQLSRELVSDMNNTWERMMEQMDPPLQTLLGQVPAGATRRELQAAMKGGDVEKLLDALVKVRDTVPGAARQVESVLNHQIDRGILRADHSLRELQTILNKGMAVDQLVATHTEAKIGEVTASVAGLAFAPQPGGGFALDIPGGRLTAEQIEFITRTLPDNVEPRTRSQLLEALRQVAESTLQMDGASGTIRDVKLTLDANYNPVGADMKVDAEVNNFRIPMRGPKGQQVQAEIGRTTATTSFHMDFARAADPAASPPVEARPGSFKLTGMELSLDYQQLAATYLSQFGCKLDNFGMDKEGNVTFELTYADAVGGVTAQGQLNSQGDRIGLNVGDVTIGNPLVGFMAAVVPGLETWAVQSFGLGYTAQYLGADLEGRGAELDMNAIGRHFIDQGLTIDGVSLADGGKRMVLKAEFAR